MRDDATLQTLKELADPNLYEVKRGVPIFRAHRRRTKDATGKEIEISVSDADLPEIARNMLDLQAQEGVPARIVDGHVRPAPEVPESQQPALLGFALNPRYGVFGPKGTPCIMVDTCIRRNKLAIARDRPFRSAEYYPQARTIRGVALLLRDPQLDLGIVTYVGHEKPYLYAMEDAMSDMPKTELENEPKDEEQFTPDEIQHYEKLYRYMCSKGYMTKDAAPASPGAPAAGDTALPAELGSEKKETPAHHAGTDQPQLYAKLEAAEKRIAGLIQEQERQKCAGMVERLKVDYRLDVETEIANLLARIPAERDKHIAYIRASHAPQDDQVQVYSGPVEGGLGNWPTTDEMMKRAVSAASRKGIAYEDALELVKAGKDRGV